MQPKSLVCRVAVGLAFAALIPLANATTAGAARGMEVAVQDDKVFVSDRAPGVEGGLDLARELGATTVRALVTWRSAPDFAPYDRLVAAAAARGMRVQLSLTGVPRWGGSDKVTDTTRPSAPLFAGFATAVATHFRGRVSSYSIWNEPNWRTWLVPARGAASRYRALYLAGYDAIKAADPAAKVLLGELAPHVNPPWSIGPLTFLRDIACQDKRGHRVRRCAPIKADGVALHAYEFGHPPGWRGARKGSVTIGTLGRLTKELRRLSRRRALVKPGGGPPPVHVTEFAYFASGTRATSERLRSRWLPRAFQMALRNPRVRQMTLFGLIRNPGDKWDVGLVHADGRRDAAFGKLQDWVGARRALVSGPLGSLPGG